jgi:hypothetical protein
MVLSVLFAFSALWKRVLFKHVLVDGERTVEKTAFWVFAFEQMMKVVEMYGECLRSNPFSCLFSVMHFQEVLLAGMVFWRVAECEFCL